MASVSANNAKYYVIKEQACVRPESHPSHLSEGPGKSISRIYNQLLCFELIISFTLHFSFNFLNFPLPVLTFYIVYVQAILWTMKSTFQNAFDWMVFGSATIYLLSTWGPGPV